MSEKLSLADFEIRYKNLREFNPKLEKCSVRGCKNPRDITEDLGVDTTCAYHRLLFDYWSYEVIESDKINYYFSHQKACRTAFTKWRNKMGKEECDKIVLEMAKEPINWIC